MLRWSFCLVVKYQIDKRILFAVFMQSQSLYQHRNQCRNVLKENDSFKRRSNDFKESLRFRFRLNVLRFLVSCCRFFHPTLFSCFQFTTSMFLLLFQTPNYLYSSSISRYSTCSISSTQNPMPCAQMRPSFHRHKLPGKKSQKCTYVPLRCYPPQ